MPKGGIDKDGLARTGLISTTKSRVSRSGPGLMFSVARIGTSLLAGMVRLGGSIETHPQLDIKPLTSISLSVLLVRCMVQRKPCCYQTSPISRSLLEATNAGVLTRKIRIEPER